MTAAVLAALAVMSVTAAWHPRVPPRTLDGHSGGRHGPTRRRARRRHPRHRSRSDTPFDAVAEWCDHLARSTRSGSTLTSALRETEPPPSLAADIREVVHTTDRGIPLGAALSSVRPSDDAARTAFAVLRAVADLGGDPAEPIDRTALALRARAADAADRRTQSAQARASARVLTVLPLGTLAVLLGTSEPVREVGSSPAGWGVISAGIVLNAAGWRWMQRIVNTAVA